MSLPRLDILLYAHDGRGLGHTSRSIGIGMALRRLFPDLRILLVTGCRLAGELIDRAPLDWLKLPAYETVVDRGRARGVDGRSGFRDQDLALLRARTIRDLVHLYRPRLVLVDHQPQGKHRELLPALAAGRKTTWVLGVRGVVGGVRQIRSDTAATIFRQHYRALLWYGDSRVLGTEQQLRLQDHFGCRPVECGYVSRLVELASWRGPATGPAARLAGTVSVPWSGENTAAFLATLATALERLGPAHGHWRIFTDPSDPQVRPLARLAHCTVEPPGPRYMDALRGSRMAIIYGGYNSLVDVLATGLPAVVVLRPMRDDEQRLHLELLRARTGGGLATIGEESATPDGLAALLADRLQQPPAGGNGINLGGAEHAARELAALLENRTRSDGQGAR